MKTTFICLFLFHCTNVVLGQERIEFKHSPGNFAYLGIENPFTYNNVENFKVSYYCPLGQIMITDGGKLLFKATKADTSKIVVYHITNRDSIEIYSQKLIIRKIPDPTIAINGVEISNQTNKSVYKNATKLEGFLDVDIPAFRNGFKVISFKLRIVNNTEMVYESKTPLFSQEIKGALNRLRSGDKLYWENVIAQGPDGTTRYLGKTIITTIQ